MIPSVKTRQVRTGKETRQFPRDAGVYEWEHRYTIRTLETQSMTIASCMACATFASATMYAAKYITTTDDHIITRIIP